jgi:branched-chain amino acid transport system permease protein
LPGGVVVRRVAIAVAVLALIAAPYAIQQVYYVNIASQVLLYAVFALGLNVLVGYAGLVSLGHAGLFGVAAYVVAYLLAAGHGHAVAILAGLAVGLVATAGFAALALRATGISFIMITLALGEIIWGLAYRWISITGGDNGISISSRRWSCFCLRSPRWRSSYARRSAPRFAARATSRAA